MIDRRISAARDANRRFQRVETRRDALDRQMNAIRNGGGRQLQLTRRFKNAA